MQDIPMNAVQVFTDGSKNDNNCTGSEIYVKSLKQEVKIQKRNVDFCSVFRCELIAIDEGLDLISSLPTTKKIWILTDVQHLANLHIVRDFNGMNILKKL